MMTSTLKLLSRQSPYVGPPSYETILRRFSSDIDPQAYYEDKRRREAIERGQYVEVLDLDFDAKDYDVLINDIHHNTLETKISEDLGIKYLSKATEAEAKEVVKVAGGYIFGSQQRTISIVPLVKHQRESRWIFFMVDSAAPATKILNIDEVAAVTIGGHSIVAQQSRKDSHFQDVNLLGTDFCIIHKVQKWEDYPKRQVKLYFYGKMHLSEGSKL